MSILGNIMAGTRISFGSSDINDPTAWWPMEGGFGTVAGVDVSGSGAMAMSAYYACLRNASEDIGRMPCLTYERKSETRKGVAYDHPVYDLLHDEPNSDMSPMSFTETLIHRGMGWGGGFAWIERNGRGIPMALWPIHPSRTEIKKNKETGNELVYDVRMDDTSLDSVRIPQRDMIHLHGLSADGVQGYVLSVLAKEAVGLGLASEKFGARFFGGNAIPGIVLMSEKPIEKKEAREKIIKEWNMIYQGSGKAFGTALLHDNVKLERISIPPEEAQMLGTRMFQVRDIARWFRYPPHLIADLENAKYANIYQEARNYVDYTLVPWATRLEQEYKRKLFTKDERKKFYVKFNFASLLRGDPTQRANFHTRMFALGTSINEIRQTEDEDDIGPLGDLRFVPVNMQRLEFAAENRPKPGSAPEPGTGGFNQSAFRPAIDDAIRRVFTKEEKAVARAKTKPGFDEWHKKFMADQENFYIVALTPIIETIEGIYMIELSDSLYTLANEYKAGAERDIETEVDKIIKIIGNKLEEQNG